MNDGMDFIRMNGWMVFMCFNQELLYVAIVMTGNIIYQKMEKKINISVTLFGDLLGLP